MKEKRGRKGEKGRRKLTGILFMETRTTTRQLVKIFKDTVAVSVNITLLLCKMLIEKKSIYAPKLP